MIKKDCELVKSDQYGKDLVSIYVLSDSDFTWLRAWMAKDSRKTVSHFTKLRTLKGLKKLAKRCSAMAVTMGREPKEVLWSWISYNRNHLNCSSRFLVSISFMDLGLYSRHSLYLNKHRDEEEAEREGAELAAKDGDSRPDQNHKAILLNSISIIRRELPIPEPNLGWPLLPRKVYPNEEEEFKKPEARDISVVEWVMSLPSRVTAAMINQIASDSNQTSITSDPTYDSTRKDCKSEEATQSFEEESGTNDSTCSNAETCGVDCNDTLETYSKPGWPLLRIPVSTPSDSFSEYEATEMPMGERVMNMPIQSTAVRMPNDLELHCKHFSFRELKQATSEFSPENLIGEGGCSKVYKGCLPDGKKVAVKILKPYKESLDDFSSEVDIISSLKHKHITPLIGVCVEDGHLISVYDFFPRGSLEDILHGESKKSALPWGVRFKVATALAEALNYLHNGCSRPVIHRDVKPSNILLSDDFQPQLSDFGLAIWGPMDSTFMTESNVVGTFGYIAPEYFMQGRVSDKIDVYSFGVVLLELLSGKRLISSEALEGQESLIQWAKPLLETRNLQELLDPALNGDFDIAQMHRMVRATSLCLNQLDGDRPNVSQVLEILQAEKETTEWCNLDASDVNERNDKADLSSDFVRKLYRYLSVSFKDDKSKCSYYTTTGSSPAKRSRLKLKDYLKKAQDQS